MPTNLYQRAHKFYLKGNKRKAEDCCKLSIANDGGDYESYNMLGVISIEAEKFGLAHTYFQKAVEINKEYAEGYNNLGSLYHKNSLLDEAKTYFNKAIALKPNYAESYYGLGCVYYVEKKYDQALHYYKTAIQYKPDYAEAYNNFGSILYEIGDINQANQFIKESIKLNSNLGTNGYLNDCLITLYTQDVKAVEKCIEKYLKTIAFLPEQMAILQNLLAITKWIVGKPVECKLLLRKAKDGIEHYPESRSYEDVITYNLFLEKLLKWYEDNNTDSNFSDVEPAKKMYFIGESHSLTCANKIIRIGHEHFKCETLYIRGCKIWDLINDENYKHKPAFSREVELLPEKSILVVTIGEIDCRTAFGIFKRYVTKQISWKESADYLVTRYFEKIINPLQIKGIKPFVWGIPAPHINEINKLAKKHGDEYTDFIKYINIQIRNACLTSGVKFIDNYAITSDAMGVALPNVKLDNVHLKPDVFVKALQDAMLKSSK